MSVTLYICATCRCSRSAEHDVDGRTGGELLADALQIQRNDSKDADLQLRRFDCLQACSRHCVVHLRSPGKIGYVIGGLPPTSESAQTLLNYAREYRQSADGVVPYAAWPPGIAEHFIARIPPLDQDD